jgi:UDP-N-acetyl-D-mannosaminuronic acid dehydrogenase
MDSKICVLGLGYIGLPTASIFAVHGYWVVGVDINPEVVETINRGYGHIREPGLDTLVNAATHSGHLIARPLPETADVFIIAVPTPIKQDKGADLTAVIEASESIVPNLRNGNLVILESTVPPGTTEDLVVPILEKSGLCAGQDFQVVHAPERVLPGQIMNELVQNDRILGGIDDASAKRARDLYRSFVSGEIYLTDATTAELAKLVENTYRDVNIGLANELARICEKLQTNVWEVIELANKHPRVNILQPGPGVGGHCIPVDPWFIVEKYPMDAQLIREGRLSNDQMPAHVCQSILDMVKDTKDPIVAILGLAYKPNVDDIRESPSLLIIEELKKAGVRVNIHDPNVFPDVDINQVVSDTDCLAILVNHREYGELEPENIAKSMRDKRLFTATNLISLEKWKEAGFFIRQLGNSSL